MTTATPTSRRRNAANLTLPPENAVRALVRTFGLLERVQHPYFVRFGISGSQWGVLRTLYRAECEGAASVRLTDLGGRLLIRPPSVTAVVGRLERAGLIARQASPQDLRARPVKLTPRGRQLVEKVLGNHTDRLEVILGGLNRAECDQLNHLLDRWGKHLEQVLSNSERGTEAS